MPYMTTPKFFNSNKLQNTFVDVGGNGDCGFRAVAAGLIDHVLTHPHAMPSSLLNTLLEQYVRYYPNKKPTLPGLVTPLERMQQLIKQMRMRELIETLAYALRQLAVDELRAHPEQYPGAFIHMHEGTSPRQMEQATTWIDETSIAALANKLDIPIEVQVYERLKTLPLKRNYNVDSKNPPVVMKLENAHYMPRLVLAERFSMAYQQPLSLWQSEVEVDDPSFDDVLAKTIEVDKRIVTTFEETYNKLSVMVSDGELNKEDLLSLYISSMNNSDYLQGRIAHVGLEHGNQDFFDAIYRQSGKQPSNGLVNDSSIIPELIHALSRAISIGQMSESAVYTLVDQRQDEKAGLVI